MKDTTKAILTELGERYPSLKPLEGDILSAFEMIKTSYEQGGRLYVCGNGGSASDSEHIVGELMKCFLIRRPIDDSLYSALSQFGEDGDALKASLEGALPAISLCGHSALTTAYLNDTEPTMTFAQQVVGYGRRGDVLLAISTSGNSKNCVYAATVAKAMGLKVLALTGEKSSKLSALADVTVQAPSSETFKIQEYHLPIYHALCAMLEAEFFGGTA